MKSIIFFNNTFAEKELNFIAGEKNLQKVGASEFAYIQMILTESLRLYPQNWLVSQKVTENIHIGTYIIPRGSIVLVSQWVMHHDLRYYPRPYKFDPMRWTRSARDKRPVMAFFPFQRSGSQEKEEALFWRVQVLRLVALLSHWRFELLGNPKITPDFSSHLRPKEAIWVVPRAR